MIVSVVFSVFLQRSIGRNANLRSAMDMAKSASGLFFHGGRTSVGGKQRGGFCGGLLVDKKERMTSILAPPSHPSKTQIKPTTPSDTTNTNTARTLLKWHDFNSSCDSLTLPMDTKIYI